MRGQLCGYLKFSLSNANIVWRSRPALCARDQIQGSGYARLMRIQDMAQNSFFPDAIGREAMKARANAQPQNNLPD